ncbi:MAG: hypothetical protein SynsKO_41020 [Synoicihabitans sp.]
MMEENPLERLVQNKINGYITVFFYGAPFFFGLLSYYGITHREFLEDNSLVEEIIFLTVAATALFCFFTPYWSRSVCTVLSWQRKHITTFMILMFILGLLFAWIRNAYIEYTS